jgi:single-strand DNA-binding protein
MAGETIITIVGNLTSDPELRYTQQGTPVANFTIASTERRLNRETGKWDDGDALFLRSSVWREFAEHVANSLSKGTRVVATGRLKQRSYVSKEGEKRTAFELEIDEIGPSLRYAIADVRRMTKQEDPRGQQQGNGQVSGSWQPPAQGRGTGQQPQFTPPAEEPWGTPANSGPGRDESGWSNPGNFNDETPF